MLPRVTLHLPRPLPEAGPPLRSRAFARALARAGARGGEVNLILTDAAEVRRLNREFLRKDRDTDVIAFDYTEPERSFEPRRNGRHPGLPESPSAPPRASAVRRSIWGDVYVSEEAALEQARERGIPPREELARLFLHGCLHLLGYRDGTRAERARLETVQESLLAHALAPARSAKRR